MNNIKSIAYIILSTLVLSIIVYLYTQIGVQKAQVTYYKGAYEEAIKEHNEYLADQQVIVNKMVEQNKTITEQFNKNIIKALENANESQKKIDTYVARNNILINSMSQEINDRISDLSVLPNDASTVYATTFAGLFRECQSAIVPLAKAASGHAKDSLMYQQSWPTVSENKEENK